MNQEVRTFVVDGREKGISLFEGICSKDLTSSDLSPFLYVNKESNKQILKVGMKSIAAISPDVNIIMAGSCHQISSAEPLAERPHR